MIVPTILHNYRANINVQALGFRRSGCGSSAHRYADGYGEYRILAAPCTTTGDL
jgi:hypothetical protein